MYEIEIYEFVTAWGLPVKVATRKGTSDRLTAYAVLVADEYSAVKLKSNDNSVFIDIGSHIGTWSMMMAIKYPYSDIYCYEPIPENYRLIKQNIELNSFYGIRAFPFAVSDTDEGTEIISYTDDSTKFGEEHKFIGSMLGGQGEKINITKIGLNSILDNIDNCRIMKIDCEGCEIKGFAMVTPENFEKIDYIVGEFHPWTMHYDEFYGLFKRTHEDISPPQNDNLRGFIYKRRGIK